MRFTSIIAIAMTLALPIMGSPVPAPWADTTYDLLLNLPGDFSFDIDHYLLAGRGT